MPEHPYRDPNLPVEERVADLLSRLTLEEKAGQLTQYFWFGAFGGGEADGGGSRGGEGDGGG